MVTDGDDMKGTKGTDHGGMSTNVIIVESNSLMRVGAFWKQGSEGEDMSMMYID